MFNVGWRGQVSRVYISSEGFVQALFDPGMCAAAGTSCREGAPSDDGDRPSPGLTRLERRGSGVSPGLPSVGLAALARTRPLHPAAQHSWPATRHRRKRHAPPHAPAPPPLPPHPTLPADHPPPTLPPSPKPLRGPTPPGAGAPGACLVRRRGTDAARRAPMRRLQREARGGRLKREARGGRLRREARGSRLRREARGDLSPSRRLCAARDQTGVRTRCPAAEKRAIRWGSASRWAGRRAVRRQQRLLGRGRRFRGRWRLVRRSVRSRCSAPGGSVPGLVSGIQCAPPPNDPCFCPRCHAPDTNASTPPISKMQHHRICNRYAAQCGLRDWMCTSSKRTFMTSTLEYPRYKCKYSATNIEPATDTLHIDKAEGAWLRREDQENTGCFPMGGQRTGFVSTLPPN